MIVVGLEWMSTGGLLYWFLILFENFHNKKNKKTPKPPNQTIEIKRRKIG